MQPAPKAPRTPATGDNIYRTGARRSTKPSAHSENRPSHQTQYPRFHEIAHALLRAEPDEGDESLDRAAEELVVESIAMSVCGFAGVDTSGYSIPYLASWAGQADLDVLERAAKLTDRLATRIETAFDPEPDRPEEPDAANGLMRHDDHEDRTGPMGVAHASRRPRLHRLAVRDRLPLVPDAQ
jgi:hypothetical protein